MARRRNTTPAPNRLERKINVCLKDNTVNLPYISGYNRSLQWVNFDVDNYFLERVLGIVAKSATQTAILSNRRKYVLGAGLEKGMLRQPNLTEEWEDLIEKMVTDYIWCGAMAVQVVMNMDGTSYSFFHQSVADVRMGEYNKENKIDKYYLCSDWTRAAVNNNVVEIKAWGSESPKEGVPYLIYFRKYVPFEKYYAIPDWYSCINWIKADADLSSYYVNYINNNFSATTAILYPTELSEEQKAELYDGLTETVTGKENAGSFLLLFGENGVAPTVQSMASVDADLYESVCDTIVRKIITGNRLTSPTLSGVSTSSGFSSQSEEMIAAYTLYNLTVIDEDRKFLLKCVNDLLTLNGEKGSIRIVEYNLRKEFEGDTAENEEIEDKVNDIDISDNNEL